MNPPNDVLFSSELWMRALESYARDTHLTVKLFGADLGVVLGPIHPTPFFQFFEEVGYDPGMFAECARRCIAQTGSRPAVMVSEFYGLAVVGTSLLLEGKTVGAAVAGYAFVDFSQLSEVQRLAHDAGIKAGIQFERLWQIAREQRPVPKHRLILNGELLQTLGDALLRENLRTRQYEDAVLQLQESAKAKEEVHRELQQAAFANAKLAAIVESSDDAIISKDLNGIITSWNRGAERLFGYTPEEAVGRPVTILMPADRLNEEPDILKSIREGKAIEHYETVRRRKDGTLLDISLTVSPIVDARGKVVGASKIARDITGQKRAEQALRESEAAMRSRAHELARFNQIAVGRELRMVELKRDLNELSQQHGGAALYPLDFGQEIEGELPGREAAPEESSAEPPRDGLVPLESILCTEELSRRPSRPPDYEAESRALAALVQALADSPQTILQTLAETVLEVFKAGSAGLSLLTKDEKRFYWTAIAGGWRPHLGEGTPRNFGPCGDVLDRNTPLLFRHWERRYPYLQSATPLAEEGLLVPFYVAGKAVGTIWAIAHDEQRKFDAEDLRQLESLSQFASAAYQAVGSLGALHQRTAALNLMEDAVQSRQAMEKLNVELRSSEERFRTLANAAPLLMWIAGTDKLCTYFNKPWLDFTGRTMEQELGNGWAAGVHPEDYERCLRIYSNCFDARQSFSLEYRLRRFDGQYRWILDEGTPLMAPDGTFSGYIGGCLDITARKETEAALLKSEKLAAAGRMAATVAHEINNPLESVMNLLYLLRSGVNGEDASRNLALAEEELDRVAQITRKTLAFYRDSSSPSEFSARELIDSVLSVFEHKIAEKKISVLRGDQSCTIQGAKGELQQLFSNLIGNAVDAVPVGGRVEVSACNNGEGQVIAIQDNGPGISPENLPKLFEPFFSTKKQHKGTGLGLWISKEIAQKYGASIAVESSTDASRHGTTFKVVFPAAHAQSMPAAS
jgi:PAS domain S-box-containing protein